MTRFLPAFAGQALKRESENPQMKFISDVARGFCGNKEIRSKYGDLVEHICKQLFDKVMTMCIIFPLLVFNTQNHHQEATGHAHALMYRFQDTSDWDAVATIQYLVPHQRQYCVDAMMCKPEMFVFQRLSDPQL